MVTSFAAIVNLPRGFANGDKSHPVALVIAVICCVGCWALRRWARGAQRLSWLFRAATLRSLALVLVFGITAFVNWQAERDLPASWYKPGTSQH
jgi:ABC-type amino acid transport system permease subunit